MPILAYVLLSILLITALAALGRHMGFRALCPICAGVALTWVGLLGIRSAGFTIDDTLLALLMGASVVGLHHALERRAFDAQGTPLWWKTAFILAGFSGAQGLIEYNWTLFLAAVAMLAVLIGWGLFGAGSKPGIDSPSTSGVKTLTEQMKNCC